MRALCLILALLWLGESQAQAEQLLDLSIDTDSGAVLLTLERFPADFLYVPALQSGAGSNDLGLDRGQLQRTRWVRFERYGKRILLVEPNLAFRADTSNSAERKAVQEAFASSVIAGFEISHSDGDAVTFDLTPLLVSDVTRISNLITTLEQGSFQLDADRSAVDTQDIRVFPQNALIPVVMTFSGTEPGDFISDVTPTPDLMSVRVTHQFVAIPDDDYETRSNHPRSGMFDLQYLDYAAALDEPLQQRIIYRHRLSDDEPLRYYVDNGTPEPIRSALIEGASWWQEAFAAAGHDNGFVVDVLPENADPLDVRYNTIQWVHRSTRGWSYGFSVSDPRTAEIIKGHVSLGSLRVRQDQLIAEALTAPFDAEDGGQSAAAQEMALARLRQLSAHEVGHTLGISHNFAASFTGDGSVMDYPHPNLYLDENGDILLDKAYRTGVSEWDKLVVRYGYTDFADGNEQAGLNEILQEASRKGLTFISDPDSRVAGSAHPESHLWDNGNDVLQRLDELLDIRQVGLENFSSSALPPNRPLYELEQRLVPVYLLHRYQVEAAAKLIGGVYYSYALKGESASLKPVGPEAQRRALGDILALLKADKLALPANLHYLVPPPPDGFKRGREAFSGTTGPTFDHFSPARAATDLVLAELLNPQRLSRVAEQHALDTSLPGVDELFAGLMDATWLSKPGKQSSHELVRQIVNWRVLNGTMQLASSENSNEIVRQHAINALLDLSDSLQRPARRGDAHARAARQDIQAYFEGRLSFPKSPAEAVPPGSPIG